jgi:hypothetical protein
VLTPQLNREGDALGEAVFCEGIGGGEQDGRLRAGERRDAVQGVEGDAQVG